MGKINLALKFLDIFAVHFNIRNNAMSLNNVVLRRGVISSGDFKTTTRCQRHNTLHRALAK